MNRLPPVPELVRAWQERDASYDGVFLLGVRTTGVFCRPSCRAKKPLPENVEYFPGAEEAFRAGYRPCKRCRPTEHPGEPPEWAATLLAKVDSSPQTRFTDADLRGLGLEPARVRRYFRSRFGMTFQAYHRSRRMGVAVRELQQGAGILDVGSEVGFESASGFRDAYSRTFRATPGEAARATVLTTQTISTPLGPMAAAACDAGLALLEFADRKRLPDQWKTVERWLGARPVPGSHPYLRQIDDELQQYFAGKRKTFSVPLVAPGTPFQELVWNRLLEIPFGQTMSYGSLATAVERPGAQRAVGKANGDNRLAIVIPCHRVVQANGELRGYGGGLWRKQRLLELERGEQSLL